MLGRVAGGWGAEGRVRVSRRRWNHTGITLESGPMQSRASSLAAQPVTLALALALAAAAAGIEKIKHRRRCRVRAAVRTYGKPGHRCTAGAAGFRHWNLESRGSLALGATFFRTVTVPLTVYPN